MSGATSATQIASAGAGSGSLLGGLAQLAPSVIGGVGKAVTASGGASAANAVGAYQANLAETNARLIELQAQSAADASAVQEANVNRAAGQLESKQRAGFAANGVALNEGSPVNVRASTRYMRDLDLDTVRANAARAAFGYQIQEGTQRQRASVIRANETSPGGAAATSLLGSASGVASKWYQLYNNGSFGNTANPAPAASGDTSYGSSLFSSSGMFGD